MKTPVRSYKNILVKMEAFQPGSSHKARSARYIIRRAIAEGHLQPGGTVRLIEKSGGNLGVGLAFEAARHGIGVDLVIGLSFSRTKRALCQRFGARIVGEDLLRKGLSPKEVITLKLQEMPDDYFFVDQFSNANNLAAHLAETGPEFATQIAEVLAPGQRLILVKGAGTGASFQGIATRLRARFDNVSCELVMPEGCDFGTNTYSDHPLEGFAVGVRPPFLDFEIVDGIHVLSPGAAIEGQNAMALDLGFFPGMTSGANYSAARAVAAQYPDALVVTLAYDSGESYLLSALLKEKIQPRAQQKEILEDV